MKKTHKVLLVLLGVIVLTVAGFKAMQPKEPEYQGRKLSEWMADFDDNEEQSKKATEALRVMGPITLPFLVEQVAAEPPAWKLQARRAALKMGYKQFGNTSEEINQIRAFWALAFLETNASPALPALVAKLGETKNENTSIQLILANAGPAAVPDLVKALNSRSDVSRFRAINVLRMIGEDASAAIPALVKIRADSQFQQAADAAIGQIDPKTAKGLTNPKTP